MISREWSALSQRFDFRSEQCLHNDGAASERLKRTTLLKRHGNDWRVSASRRSRHSKEGAHEGGGGGEELSSLPG
jgi:hypothetical protein